MSKRKSCLPPFFSVRAKLLFTVCLEIPVYNENQSSIQRAYTLKTESLHFWWHFSLFIDNHTLHLISQGFEHPNPDVCLAAFAAVCHIKKKSTVPSSEQLALCIQFIIDHLTVDDPSFRQNLISDFTIMMIRCRDASLNLMKKKNDERQDVT